MKNNTKWNSAMSTWDVMAALNGKTVPHSQPDEAKPGIPRKKTPIDPDDWRTWDEEKTQIEFIVFLKKMAKDYPPLGAYQVSASGGARDAIAGARLKRTGLRRGIPDIFIPMLIHGYGGIYIELKRFKGGTVSEEQRAEIERLRSFGYCAVVCRGLESAKDAVKQYISGEMTADIMKEYN